MESCISLICEVNKSVDFNVSPQIQSKEKKNVTKI